MEKKEHVLKLLYFYGVGFFSSLLLAFKGMDLISYSHFFPYMNMHQLACAFSYEKLEGGVLNSGYVAF